MSLVLELVVPLVICSKFSWIIITVEYWCQKRFGKYLTRIWTLMGILIFIYLIFFESLLLSDKNYVISFLFDQQTTFLLVVTNYFNSPLTYSRNIHSFIWVFIVRGFVDFSIFLLKFSLLIWCLCLKWCISLLIYNIS